GPVEWDVSRLVASIVVLARESGANAGTAERAVEHCLRSYREQIARYSEAKELDIWYDLIDVDQFVGLFCPAEQEQIFAHISRKARRRTSVGAARKLTERNGDSVRITEDPPVRVRLDAEPALADAVFEAY